MRFLRKHWDVIQNVIVLAVTVGAGVFAFSQSKGGTPPPGIPEAQWKVFAEFNNDLIHILATFLLVILGQVTLISSLKSKLDTSTKTFTETAWNIRALGDMNHTLDELLRCMHEARTRILLLYLRPTPTPGNKTEGYWAEQTRLLGGARDHGVPVRRIASIDTLAKLKFLLANNATVLALSNAEKLSYRLLIFPSVLLKPPQWDIVDGNLFLFTPDPTKETLIVTKLDVVERYAAEYTRLAESLEPNYMLLDTYGKNVYSESELLNISRALKYVLRITSARELRDVYELVKPRVSPEYDETWFVKQCAEVGPWPDLLHH